MKDIKNNLLDMSSDIIVSGVILSFLLLLINKQLGPKETSLILGYFACSSIWKISSPFSNPNRIGWIRYIWVLCLLFLMVMIPLIILHL